MGEAEARFFAAEVRGILTDAGLVLRGYQLPRSICIGVPVDDPMTLFWVGVTLAFHLGEHVHHLYAKIDPVQKILYFPLLPFD